VSQPPAADAVLVWDGLLATYRFKPGHPLDPRRLELTVELIHRLGLAGGPRFPVVPPRPATDDELRLAHAPEYIEAVRRLSRPDADTRHAARWGFGTEDNPIVPGMHDAARLVCGSTLVAAELVMDGRARRAFSIAGGLHHARRAEAAGFCIYNDLAVAARWMNRHYGARVLYIDFDAHHGDGVQQIFYDDPEILTLSFHESGTYLFPGTGFVDEVGDGDGYGYAVNVPLDAHTEDASFREAFRALVPEIAGAFQPDVILLQCGCDAHVLDPLTHLRCTTGLFEELVRVVSDVADRHCGGRIVATGGGGYAIHTVVPRAWTLVWAALSGQHAPDAIPLDWLRALRVEHGREVPTTLRDAANAFPASARRSEVEAINRRTVQSVRRRCMPLISGWGLSF